MATSTSTTTIRLSSVHHQPPATQKLRRDLRSPSPLNRSNFRPTIFNHHFRSSAATQKLRPPSSVDLQLPRSVHFSSSFKTTITTIFDLHLCPELRPPISAFRQQLHPPTPFLPTFFLLSPPASTSPSTISPSSTTSPRICSNSDGNTIFVLLQQPRTSVTHHRKPSIETTTSIEPSPDSIRHFRRSSRTNIEEMMEL